ncbi:MAG: SAM-dependent chlorinase/fluorinase [Chitinophagales bacterium]|nr:SAM-dependent chlorinase/fluorinase [Chitinophagales bacterium]
MAIISLLTDFGNEDFYVPAFKGALYSACPSAKIVDVSHTIKPYDIVNAAFFAKHVYQTFPKGTIHIIRVYEQGLTKQKLLAAKYQNYYFIAPDNGLLTLIFDDKPDLLVEVDTKQVQFKNTDEYYCRVVKEIVFNNNIGEIGKATSDYKVKNSMMSVIQADKIIGTVVYIDNFGNAITNIHQTDFDRFIATNSTWRINYRKYDYIDEIVEDYTDVNKSYNLARFNNHGYLELCIHCGSAAQLLGLQIGDSIQIVNE